MNRHTFVKRSRTFKGRYYFMLFMVTLIFTSGMLPSLTSLGESHEGEIIVEPVISNDVDGESEKEILLGENFNYNIKVSLPEDISNYESMMISDDLSKHIVIQDTSVLVNGEVTEELEAEVNGQNVSLTLLDEQFNDFVGDEITLQIATQVQENIDEDEEITNVAEVVINNDIVLTTNDAIVTLTDSDVVENENTDELAEETEEKDEEETEEETKEKSEEEIFEIEEFETNEVNNEINHSSEVGVCAFPVALANGSFEEGPAEGSFNDSKYMFKESEVPGWRTTDDSQGEKVIEIWDYAQGFPSVVLSLPPPPEGNRYAELNAYDNGMLYQDIETYPGQTIYWRLSHMGRVGVDTMQLRIGEVTNDPYDTQIIEQMSDGNTAWGHYTGTYTVPAGQTVTRFGFEAVSSANGNLGAGNLLDDIFLGTEPCVTAVKTVDPEGEVYAGDELTYEVTVKNDGGDVAADTIFEDNIPEGTEFVPGSIKVDGESIDDTHYDDNNKKLVINLGDLRNTNDLPEGITVEFKVKVLSSHIGETVLNKANIGYTNLLIGENEGAETNEVTNKVIYKDPELESTKSAELETKAEGNTDADHPEVGDTIRYTITTQNTIEDSIVDNLIITDEIPEGMTYVDESLEIDGESVTDAEDSDAGHVIDRQVTGTFGSITDTDAHSITFLVTVDNGQAGQDIKNIAVVEGDNTDPDEPEEEVNIYPREPVLEGEKSAVNKEEGKENFEVGDTVIYTIQGRNTVSDSLVKDFVITDELPTGLELVSDSIATSHNGTIDVIDGVITATFGDVEDTDWRTVTFEAVIQSGQADQTIGNVAIVEGDDHEGEEVPPVTPEEEIEVDYKDPSLDSSKTAELETKADGNTDANHPEVGDTIRYTITTQNTIEDSIVENLVITDEIPEGVTYVAGSLKVDGESVTDAEDTDAGHVVDGLVTGSFGSITDTDTHSVTFLVTVDEGQAGKDIKNIAVVDSDSSVDPDEPEEEVEIYPREPVLEGEKTAENKEEGKDIYEVGDTVIYTIKGRNIVSNSLVENFKISDELPDGLKFVEDSLIVSHDEGEANYTDGVITATFGDVEDTDWRTVTFEAVIQSGQADQTIGNIAVVEGDDHEGEEVPPVTPEEEIEVHYKDPSLDSSKTAELEIKADGNTDADHPEVGDTIRYTITTKNMIEDSIIENLVITDEIPEGVTYVSESLEVDSESVTDAEDDDAGHVVDEQITGTFGDVTDTDEHTITFLVTVDEGQAGKDIKNIAVVDSDSPVDPDEPEEEVEIYPRAPVLEGEKSAENKEKDKDKYEVGDTVIYMIQGRNTVSDSLVEDFVISDELPEGLEFVEDSLIVSHEGEANYTDGVITATFGDVEDTDWRTVTFEAVIQSGHAGKTIGNIATVGGDDHEGEEVPPVTPEEGIEVDYKDPSLDSSKTAELETKADGNTDADHPEVGDTIRYTITTQNTVEDSIVENLVITDEIPKGVTYVAGSLKIDGESVTDAEDTDAGHVINGLVTGTFGSITDTDTHSVTFLVTVDEGQAGQDITNIAVVEGDNTDPDDPEEEVEVYPREPVLEGEKLAVNKEEGKDTFEVGDTVIYTIKGRNTVSDSLVEDFNISDELPEGLEFVAGSLETSDGGSAEFTNGVINATFDEVNDTEWRIVTFEAVIQSGQADQTINNVAAVGGKDTDGNDIPTTNPEEKIVVAMKDLIEPSEPEQLENDKKLPKTATNMFNLIILGLGLVIAGVIAQTFRRRKA